MEILKVDIFSVLKLAFLVILGYFVILESGLFTFAALIFLYSRQEALYDQKAEERLQVLEDIRKRS